MNHAFGQAMYLIIASLSLINLGRILAMIVGSDMYEMKNLITKKKVKKLRAHRPLLTLIIPAYNEEVGVLRTLESVLDNTYNRIQIIVVNDGSKDKTAVVVRRYISKYNRLRANLTDSKTPTFKYPTVTLVNKKNGGKATAINLAIRRYAKGSLVMVLDADSVLRPDAIANMVAHFRDRKIAACSANVKVLSHFSLLGIAQRYEYLISYRMKRALAIYNMEYIIGGVGSTFRRSVLDKVGHMDTDTMTEDIDLAVKIIHKLGNKHSRIHYAADAVAYTEHVMSLKSLIRQRYRWKYGRFQTFLKHRALFFKSSKIHDKRLTWLQLPYSVFGELIMFLEPFLVIYIISIVLLYGDLTSIVSVYLIVTGYVLLMLMGETTEKLKDKLYMSLFLPFIYFILYVLSAVEYISLLKSIKNRKSLINNDGHLGKWEHVERSGQAVIL